MKLKFKNVGWFLEEDSARYEAKVNEHLTFRIYKSPYKDWFNGWVFEILTSEGIELNGTTSNYLADWYDKATKKEAIEFLESISESEIKKFTGLAIQINKEMQPYLK